MLAKTVVAVSDVATVDVTIVLGEATVSVGQGSGGKIGHGRGCCSCQVLQFIPMHTVGPMHATDQRVPGDVVAGLRLWRTGGVP